MKIKITESDFVEAQWLHMKTNLKMKVRPLFWYLCLLFAIPGMVLAFVYCLYQWTQGITPDWQFWLIYGAIIYVFIIYCIYFPRRWENIYKQTRLLQEESDLEFSEDGLSGSSDRGEAKLEWDLFKKWKEGKNIIILYQGDFYMNIIPKRCFETEKALDETLELIRSKISKSQ